MFHPQTAFRLMLLVCRAFVSKPAFLPRLIKFHGALWQLYANISGMAPPPPIPYACAVVGTGKSQERLLQLIAIMNYKTIL